MNSTFELDEHGLFNNWWASDQADGGFTQTTKNAAFAAWMARAALCGTPAPTSDGVATRLYDDQHPMADGSEKLTAAEDVLTWLVIEKLGCADDRSYTPHEAQKLIEAALLHAPASEGVAVKPLEWFGNAVDKFHSRGGLYTYEISHDGDEPDEWSMRREGKLIGYYGTEAAARNAAQSDHKTQILSALLPAPTSEGVATDFQDGWDAHELHLAMHPAPTRDDVLGEIAAERRRQVEVEGWTEAHDDQHTQGEMARAAGVYALLAGCDATDYRNATTGYGLNDVLEGLVKHYWPWDVVWFKPKDRRRDLIRAGALIVAEIERLGRALKGAKP